MSVFKSEQNRIHHDDDDDDLFFLQPFVLQEIFYH